MKKVILVVDDTRVLAQSIADMLTMEGFAVHTRYQGADALALLDTARIDLVITDLRMQPMDGLEITRCIKASTKGNIPVIILTADTSRDNASQGYEAGASLVLHKPFDHETFLQAIFDLVK